MRSPAWQRDSILLLCYCGLEDLIRDASTGVKETVGFDLVQLNVELSAAFLVAFLWVGVALLTGVLGDFRYDRPRVVLTWAIAAPLAQLAKVALYGGTLGYFRPDDAITDIVCTLGLQLGLRYAEENNLL